jgi:anti-sigma factor RsiW
MTLRPSWRGHLSGQWVTLYLAGELAPEDAAATQAHLVACDTCARVCEDQRLAQRLLRARTMERPLPAELDARIQASLRARTDSPRGAASLRFLWATRQARRRVEPRPHVAATDSSSAHERPLAPPLAPAKRHGSFPGVAAVLAMALLLFVALGGVMPPLPTLTLPVVGAGATHPKLAVTPTPNRAAEPVHHPSGTIAPNGAGGRQQMR